MQKSRLEAKIRKLPKTPGVYIFYGRASAQGGFRRAQVLYVGKATSLRSRVGSYFLTSERFNLSQPKRPKEVEPLNFSRPIDFAIGQIADIKTIETETVLEAFILEQDLIKRLQPKYNAMGKDDKSFCYVVLTKEEFPRFIIIRERELEKMKNAKVKMQNYNAKFKIDKIGKKFGPYTSKKNIEIVLKLLKRIFPFHSSVQNTEKGCLDSQIGLCPAPYDGKITREDYMKNIRGIRMILEGKKKGLVKKLEKEMKSYSKEHEYEKAADVRNQIFALRHIRDVALISAPQSSAFSSPDKSRDSSKPSFSRAEIFRIEAYDISNISGLYAVGSMVVFDNMNGHFEPNKNEYRKFKIKTIQGADDVRMMQEILMRRFNNNWPKPDLILLDGGVGHLHMAEKVLKNLKIYIPLATVAKDKNRKEFTVHGSQSTVISHQIDDIKNILSNKNLIKQIMDEAHRFAITYHKKVRRREFVQT